MKTVFFVRHAKSSWDNPLLSDHDRPLNARGKKDAVSMGIKIKNRDWIPAKIISSTAKRAKKTAKKINKTLDIENIELNDRLYHASPHTIFSVLKQLNDEIPSVMIVAHNPAMTEIINYFSRDFIPNVPTTGIFKIDFDVTNWDEINFENGKLIDFIYPKMFLNE